RPLVGLSMFGLTTPAVDEARAELTELGYEALVFHATGAGGRAMEKLATDGRLAGVLDLTTTELADDLVSGVLSAGPHRLEAAGAAGIPQVVSLGALDMVNFGPREHVPDQFDERSFVVHNPTVTLMRTTPEENSRLGERIGAKLAAATGPTAVVLPAGRPERYRHRRPAVPPPAGRRRTLRRAARRPGRLRRGGGRVRA